MMPDPIPSATPAEVPMVSPAWAHPSHFRPRPPGQLGYRLCIIHITDGHPDAHGTAEMFQQPMPDGKVGTSSHFIVGQDATTLQCVPLRFAAEHAHEANAYSIGIEHSARSPGSWGRTDPGMPPSLVQYKASAKLVAYLLYAAGLAPTREFVKGHKEADPETDHDDCPDKAPWDWATYMQLVVQEYVALGGAAPAPAVA